MSTASRGDYTFPDLFVLGAQKSGTTSLCAWLEQSDSITLSSPKEPMLLSRDEIALHPHFFTESPNDWSQLDWDADRKTILSQYQQYFANAAKGTLLCDGSTSYLYSERAPGRIKHVNPNAKFIIILRDPAARSYSAYWHYVKTGIACESFANHIRYEGGLTIEGSEYVRHIKRWLEVFPREQFLFLAYEAMKADPQACAKQLSEFLSIAPLPSQLPRENRGKTPRNLTAQLWLNRIRRWLNLNPSAIETRTPGLIDVIQQWNMTDTPYPPMEPKMRQRLNQHFKRANAELADLTGLAIKNHWYRD